MAIYLGVDTGGTFTDFTLFDDEAKTLRIHKVLSTPAAPEKAILQGIEALAIEADRLKMIHGSTVATNAVLEGKGVRTAYITNTGVGDVLAIGRQAREALYDLTPEKKPRFIEAELCLEVDSRLDAGGRALQRVSDKDLDALRLQLQRLAPDAVAINLLFSFIDADEEIKIEQMISAFDDDIFISRSSDVLSEYGEFERGMTTTLNAMVGPLMQGYLSRLNRRLTADFQHCSLSIMQSSGGTTSAEQAGRYPVNLLLSGPAGGLKGAQCVAAASAETRLLSFDMGGTSTDVSIIDGDIGFTTGAKIGGHPVAVSMVDMHTIGAGGGSLARIDAGGMLLVGPESAGASPGPACYGNGGTRATVTDANVVLGRLQPRTFLGGQMQLGYEAAVSAVQQVAESLGLSVESAAQGIIDVVNDHMVRALRVMSVERGEDPKDYTLVSFGGAGGLHVCALAEELEMEKALVPVDAGVLSALGMLAADASRERSRSINTLLSDCDQVLLAGLFDELEHLAVTELNASSAAPLDLQRSLDIRYRGQSHSLNIAWRDYASIEQIFHQRHQSSYGHQLPMEIELVNLRVRAIERSRYFDLPDWEASESSPPQAISMPEYDTEVPVIARGSLQTGQQIDGPALITETSSTTWLSPGWSARVDTKGNLLLRHA